MSDYRITYVSPEIHVVDRPLTRQSADQWQASVDFKALAFKRDQNFSTLNYEFKRVRAMFDPGLGPNGGYRCPVGTRYGGQITDRFGRGCGWGAARRLLNAAVDAGERLEEIGDRRRGRRVERRNRRVARQIGKPMSGGRRGRTVTGGRIDRMAARADRFAGRARRFAERMDGNAGRPRRERNDRTITGGRIDRAAEGADRFADRARRFAERMVGPGGGGRRRRTSASAQAAANRPRPSRPQMQPAAAVRRPTVAQRGARIDVDNLTPERRERLNVLIARERDSINNFWRRELAQDPTSALMDFRLMRAEDSDPRWRDVLATRKREWEILNSDNAAERVNELSPTARKRIADRLGDPNTPRPAKKAVVKKRPAKKAPAKKAPAKKAPAKKAPAKKAPAKKAPAKKAVAKKAAASRAVTWDRDVPRLEDLNDRDKRWVRGQVSLYHGPDKQRAIERFIQEGGDLEREIRSGEQQIELFKREAQNADLTDMRRVLAAERVRNIEREVGQLRDAMNAPRNPDAPAKKAPAKKAPAKKAPAKKAAASRNQGGPENPEPSSAPNSPNASGAAPDQGREDLGKPRQLGRGRLRRKNRGTEARLGGFDANGFANPARVEVGNKGLNTQTQANTHVGNGGDLADVPDDFLEKAIRQHSGPGKRFRIDRSPASANSPTLLTDTTTNQRLMVKKYRPNAIGFNEDMNEIIGLNIQERFGFLNGAMRFAGPLNGDPNSPNTTAPIVLELGQNMLDDALNERPDPNNAVTGDLLRLTMMDFAIINSDRHGGNYFTVKQGGKVRIYPIDPSLGFDARKGPSMFPGTGNAAGFQQWVRHRYGGGRNRVTNILGTRAVRERAEMVAEIRKIQQDLKRAERQEKASNMITRFQGIFPGRQYATDGGRNHQNAAKRLKYLMDANAEDLLDIILGR